MAGRRELERHLQALADIGAILGVMKNLTLMESGKLSPVLAAQREMAVSLESSAAEFLAFYPQPQATGGEIIAIELLIGTQRGFCGDFNDLILAALAADCTDCPRPLRIAVGDKLAGRLPVDLALPGPHATEETGQVIHAVMEAIGTLLAGNSDGRALKLEAVHHDPDSGTVVTRRLAPVATMTPRVVPGMVAPLLYLSPESFFGQLAEQHLLAVLTEVFHRSQMAETRFRLNHIEGALHRMERRSAELTRKLAIGRQEAIIEEIESILASAGLEDGSS